jgi:hypothetical protein
MKKKTILVGMIVIALIGFLVWRFIRPMNIFIVEEKFAWPIDTSRSPQLLGNLSAEECGFCHAEFLEEWKTTIHSQAWTDPYFQKDWQFDGKQHICRLCHTPLDRQQPHKVLGYRDQNKWDPIMEDNPEFDVKLQHEGVTCAACHYRDGKIIGVLGNTNAPHPVKKLDDPKQVCIRCHVVAAESWGTFVRFPPCGTVAEIERSGGNASAPPPSSPIPKIGKSGEIKMSGVSSLGCVSCHMPMVERPLVAGGEVRPTRRHLWRGGHDPEKVKQAFTAELIEQDSTGYEKRAFTFTLINVGAAHYLPTGTPDRYLTVQLRLLDGQGQVIKELNDTLKRTVIWRPFIIDLWDTRLPRWQPKTYQLDVSKKDNAATIEAVVHYHLLNEKRRKRIGYENKEPIAYEVYRKKISLGLEPERAGG